MKRIFRYIVLSMTAVTGVCVSSCDDFSTTDPDNILNVGDYISTENEMYRGFLGIITRMQNAGDHAIFLTDPRCNFLEIAPNAPVALQNIYNYEPTDGNEYADPTCYYEIVTACNDYFDKMAEYQREIGSSMSESAAADFPKLISSAVRIKVWAYYTLGRIYGKAVWFDDPLEELKDLNDASIFTHLDDMKAVADKCIDLLDNGIEINGTRYAADLEMEWPAWIDPETQNTAYEYWDYLTPPWLLLRAELLSWRCSYQDNEADWRWIRDNILQYLDDIWCNRYIPHMSGPFAEDDDSNNAGHYYACNIPAQHNYYNIFFSEQVGTTLQLICGIMYDYDNKQRNRLVQYFCPSYPGDGFYLQPSQYGINLYPETDIRSLTQRQVMAPINGQTAFTKYYYSRQGGRNFTYLRTNIFEIQPTIVLFRGHDFHFLLAEAENHLGNWHQAKTILNNGLENEFPGRNLNDAAPSWDSRYSSWFGTNGGYGDVGIVGMVKGTEHNLPVEDENNPGQFVYTDDEGNVIRTVTEEERKKLYDLALADEYLLEYTGEGKSYSYLVKMAERYRNQGDAQADTIVSNRIAPKYPDGAQAKVRASLAGNYFIDWDLTGK